jgi:DNA polymerase-3 subunit beta
MKINVKKTYLLNVLRNMISVSGKVKNSILQNCHLAIASTGLVFSSTDNEIALTEKVEAGATDINKDKILFDPARLLAIVKELPDNEINLIVTDSALKVVPEKIKGNYKIPMGPAPEEYPLLDNLDHVYTDINQQKLANLIQNVIYAASPDTIKPVFNGVYIIQNAGSITVVATDSRRMSISTVEHDMQFTGESMNPMSKGIILPLRSALELLKLLGTGICSIGAVKNQFRAEFGKDQHLTFTSRLIEGQYPDFKNVMRDDSKVEIAVDRGALVSALRRALIFTVEPAHKAKLKFAKNNLNIAVESPLGFSAEEVSFEYICGEEEIEMGMNTKFMLESVMSINCDKVIIKIDGAMSPMVISPATIDGFHIDALIMPIQIKAAEGN